MTKGIRQIAWIAGLGCLTANVCGLFFGLHVMLAGGSHHHDSGHCDYCQSTFMHSKPAIEAVYEADIAVLIDLGRLDLIEDSPVRGSGFFSKIERGPPARN